MIISGFMAYTNVYMDGDELRKNMTVKLVRMVILWNSKLQINAFSFRLS